MRTFPLRTCSDAKFRRHERLGKPCLLFHIEKCSGPCVGEVAAERYAELVEEFMQFLDGDTEPVLQRLETEMRSAAENMEFEPRPGSATGWPLSAVRSNASRWSRTPTRASM
ncbi:MAG: hypothetical protein R2789_09605 [Microthrixaceae bacterium]